MACKGKCKYLGKGHPVRRLMVNKISPFEKGYVRCSTCNTYIEPPFDPKLCDGIYCLCCNYKVTRTGKTGGTKRAFAQAKRNKVVRDEHVVPQSPLTC